MVLLSVDRQRLAQIIEGVRHLVRVCLDLQWKWSWLPRERGRSPRGYEPANFASRARRATLKRTPNGLAAMSCCGGAAIDETTKEIDRLIKKEARQFREQVKLLLLGSFVDLRGETAVRT